MTKVDAEAIHEVLAQYVTKGGGVLIDEDEGYALAASGIARIEGPKGAATIVFLCGCSRHIYNQLGARRRRVEDNRKQYAPKGGMIPERRN